MAIKRDVLLFSAVGLLSLAGALLCLALTGLRLELKYVGVTVGFFLAMLSVAKVQELRRAMRTAPAEPEASQAPTRDLHSTSKPQFMQAPAGVDEDDDEDAELQARLAQLRARAHSVPAEPAVASPHPAPHATPQATAQATAPAPSALNQRGDELRADIARLREGSRARRVQPAAADAAVSVAPPGFLEELSTPSSRASVPAPLTPQPAPAVASAHARPVAAVPADDDDGDPFARTQISGLEVTHVQSLTEQEEREAFAKTEFTDFGHADHGQFASTEYLGPPGPKK